MSYSDFACVGCEKTEKEIEECRIYQYKFKVFDKRCPRQGPQPPKVIAEDVAGDQYLELPLELIYWKEPIRREITEEDVNDMSTSLVCHGQIHHIVVKPPDEKGTYEGVIGRLRYEGTKRHHGRTILARAHRFRDEAEVREWQLAENLHRRELSITQRADAYAKLRELLRQKMPHVDDEHIVSTMTKSLEEMTGEEPSKDKVWEYLRISASLSESVKKIVDRGKLGVRHVREILKLSDAPDKQVELAEKATEQGWTSEKLKREVNSILSPPEPKPSPVDTGLKFECPVCGETYMIVHVDEGKHRFQRIEVMESEH